MTKHRPKPLGSAGRNVAHNIRRLRESTSQSAQQVADRMTASGRPMAQPGLIRRELGDIHVTADELAAFAELFGVPIGELFNEAPPCMTCDDNPPSGYQCLDCRRSA